MASTDLNNLGFAFWLSGNYTEARTLYDLAVARGGTDPTTLNNLGMIEERLGRYDAAIEHYQQSLALLEKQTSARDRGSLRARILNNLGVSLTLAGRSHEGRERLSEALRMRRDLQGPEGPDYAVTLRNLGLAAHQEGRLDDARNLLEQGRDILARKQGSSSAEYARTMQLLGELHGVGGDDEAALPL